MPNIELERIDKLPTFRKIALGTWRDAYDPSVYGSLDLPMDKTLAYIDAFRERTGKRLTVTHMAARAAAAALERCPEANTVLRFNRPYRRKRISVFFQVAMESDGDGEADLSGATLEDVDKKSLVEIIDEFEDKVRKVRERKDPALERTRSSFRYIPFLLLFPFLRLLSFLTITLNLDLRRFGIPKDPFGSIMITNVGSLGLEVAYVPLVPYSRVPMLWALGAVNEVPVVEDGEIVIRKRMKASATFDHRFIDGVQAAAMAKIVRAWFTDPEENFGAIEDLPEAVSPAAEQTLEGPPVAKAPGEVGAA